MRIFRQFNSTVLLLAMSLVMPFVSHGADSGTVKADPAKADREPAAEAAPVPKNKAAARPWVIYAEQWDMTRSGDKVLALPVLQKVINAWLRDRSKIIEVQYPGGEEGEFWVQELSDWLVSLGIPSRQMIITPGSGGDDMIKFTLRRS